MSDIKLPSNKTFGFFFAFVLIFLAWLFYDGKLNHWTIGFFLLSLLLLLLTILNANLLLPLNRLWMKFGLILGKIFSPIVLGFIFLLYLRLYLYF